jgi:pimeloyl-ACP methyl ester carboxylesterase
VVVALHCSGSTGRQWHALGQAGRESFRLFAPDLIGCGGTAHWGGDCAFRLSDEARSIVSFIDAVDAPVHLVGHSYGGGVALRVALERSYRIASLTLYEPTAFHVLKSTGDDGSKALAEIRTLAETIGRHVTIGAYRTAARLFVDYWNGPGTFDSLNRAAQGDLIHYIPKACLDFQALIEERTPLVAYRRLRVPLLIMCGEYAPAPAALIARKLAAVMNPGAFRIVAGAGHMGPTTHSDAVVGAIIDHIAATDPNRTWDRTTLSQQAA